MKTNTNELAQHIGSPRRGVNIHIYPSNIKNESRIFRITNSLIEAGIVKEIIIVGKGDGELNEHDRLDESRQIWRVPLSRFSKLHWKIRKVLRYIQWLRKIYSRFRKEKIGIVNCHSIFDLPLGAWLKRATGCMLIYDTHELETERNGLKGTLKKILKRIEKKYSKYTDHVFVVCDSIARWYREAYGLDNVTTIKNVPVKKQTVKRSKKIRDLLKVPEERILYIYQGGFLEGRGIPILLSVFSRSDIHDHIVFMGYGALAEEIKEFVRQHQNIHFLEAVPPGRVVEYTSGADVGFSLFENTSLSYYCSLPNKIFEYLVSGIPCIVSDFPEMSAFVTQYQSGWTTAVDEGSVYSLITEISRGRDMIRRKKQGITKVLQRDDLGWEHEHRKLIQVYKDLMNKDN
jgi:glycosyltransferase involved in cell wall biosynthesis